MQIDAGDHPPGAIDDDAGEWHTEAAAHRLGDADLLRLADALAHALGRALGLQDGLRLADGLGLARADKLRDELIPVNSRWKVDEALDAARAYFDATGRRVSIEYALIKDMNDHEWRAELLAKKLNERGKGWVHVNPIPLNPTPGSIWTASIPEVTRVFISTLEKAGIPTTLRDTRGKEIDGACGQLAAS